MKFDFATSLFLGCTCLPMSISALEKDADGYCLISNAEDLLEYCKNSNNTVLNGRLTSDIDLSSTVGKINGEIVTISSVYSPNSSFDGCGHTISNYYGESPLFDNINRIDNLIIKNAYIKGALYSSVSGFVKKAKVMNNCHFEGVVIGNSGGRVYSLTQGCDTIINCSNYGICYGETECYLMSGTYYENCYNRGDLRGYFNYTTILDDCNFAYNIYNSGKSTNYTSLINDWSSVSNCYMLETPEYQPEMEGVNYVEIKQFKNGSVTDSLNKYVTNNPLSKNNIKLLPWVQGEDGFPRFEHVDLQPTQGHLVKFIGVYQDKLVALNGKIDLPKSSDPMYDFDFNGWDGTGIDKDTTITVSCIFNTDLEQDVDGYYLIHNIDELMTYTKYAEKDLPINVRLTTDLDLSSVCGKIDGKNVNWTPIKAKNSIFDGAGHTILNLYICDPIMSYRYGRKNVSKKSFFDEVLGVENLTIKKAFVKTMAYPAGIAYSCKYLNNCKFDGVVIGKENAYALVAISNEIVNCSNYGICISDDESIAWGSNKVVNCNNRGRLISYGTIVGACIFDRNVNISNFYNSGDLFVSLKDEPSLFLSRRTSDDDNYATNCYILTSEEGKTDDANLVEYSNIKAFKNGSITDSLNKYVLANPKTVINKTDNVLLNSWIQGDDGFPRFENDTLSPTEGYIVHFVGDLRSVFVSVDGTLELPVPSVEGFDYVMDNGFDGKNITSDTIVRVSMVPNSAFKLRKDDEGFFIIRNGEELNYFSESVNRGASKIKGRMTNDIDMSLYSKNWSAIGANDFEYLIYMDMYFRDTIFFEGVFDGGNFAIKNLYNPCLNGSGGIFSFVKNATIKNVTIQNAFFDGLDRNSFIGYAENSEIVNCGLDSIKHETRGHTMAAGICTKTLNCTIKNCYSIGDSDINKVAYAFAGGIDEIEKNSTIVENAYAIMTTNYDENEKYVNKFCSSDIVNIKNCYVDTLLSVSVVADGGVIGTNPEFLQSEKYVNELNRWVDSMNAVQSHIVYNKWEIDPKDGYPKLKIAKPEVTKNCESIQSNDRSLTVYAVGSDLNIKSEIDGHATIFDINGRAVESVIYYKGLTTVSGLPFGYYIIEGTKILIK